MKSLLWRHNGRDGVSNQEPHHCLLNRLFGSRSKKISKLRVTGLCAGNSPVTGEFPAQMASNAENASIWWRHHVILKNMGKMGGARPQNTRDHFGYVFSQWKTPLHCNVASHWLILYPEWFLNANSAYHSWDFEVAEFDKDVSMACFRTPCYHHKSAISHSYHGHHGAGDVCTHHFRVRHIY